MSLAQGRHTVIRRVGRLTPAYVIAALAIILASCTTVAIVRDPAQYLARHRPEHVWLTGPDSSVIPMDAPMLRGDTIVGTVNGEARHVPLAPGTLLEVQQLSPGRTSLLTLLAAGTAAATIYAITGSSNPCQPACPVKPGCPPVPCPESALLP